MSRTLVVTAVGAERDAVARSMRTTPSTIGPYESLTATTPAGRIDLLAGGVGTPAAAACTATALALAGYDLVINAGIAGGFAPRSIGAVLVASAVVAADLGVESPHGWLEPSGLGLGLVRTELDRSLVGELAERLGADTGAVLSTSRVTGTVATEAARRGRFPDAVAEAMEGAGVLAAALAHGVAFAEVRSISNCVGPRDRSAWRIETALDALAAAFAALFATPMATRR